jgi:hypothetical protein
MRDFENILNLDELDAVAVQAIVWQELDEEPALDAEHLEVQVTDDRVRIAGRVSTDREHAKVVHVVEDILGSARFDDAIRVDETLRGLRPEGADRSVAEVEEARPDLGKDGRHGPASAEHLRPDPEGDLYGTRDARAAAAKAQPYIPPSGPVREEEGDEQH